MSTTHPKPDPIPSPVQVPVSPFRVLSQVDLAAETSSTEWLWQGYLARKNITLLTSQWKVGKTTLLAALLARMQSGGELGGLQVVPGKALVVSEEGPELWAERNRELDLGPHSWLCRQFRGRLDQEDWMELMKQIAAEQAVHPVDLIVIDPLLAFFPANAEFDSYRLKTILALLRGLADSGASLLLLHHPRKGRTPAGQAARGSGLISSFVDILIEMFPYKRADEADRRRRLQAYSRHKATPTQWVIELNADGHTYTGHGDVGTSDYLHDWPIIHQILRQAKRKITLKELLEAWPPGLPAPAYGTLWRWLDRAGQEGLALKRGTGHKNDPHRYWLPGQEEIWQKDPLYTPTFEEIMESFHKGTQGV